MKEQLKQAGLTENESKVYMALLELGPSQAGLIARMSGLHRRVIYDTLDRMVKKGLVGYILRNNLRLYQASNPERILEIIKERESSVEEVMPRLMEMFSKTQEKEETNFYKGKQGLKNVFEDQLSSGKEIFVIGASPYAHEILKFYFHWYEKRKAQKKIKAKMIFHQEGKSKGIIASPYSEIRVLPRKYASPVAVNIYGDKVAIILWSVKNPFAIVVQSKEIVDGYRKYFDFMWRFAKPLKS